jgi:hypothetical protein
MESSLVLGGGNLIGRCGGGPCDADRWTGGAAWNAACPNSPVLLMMVHLLMVELCDAETPLKHNPNPSQIPVMIPRCLLQYWEALVQIPIPVYLSRNVAISRSAGIVVQF